MADPDFSRVPKRHTVITSASADIVDLASLLNGGAYEPGCNRFVIRNCGPADPIYYRYVKLGIAPTLLTDMDEIPAGLQVDLPFRSQDVTGKVFVQVDVGTKITVWEIQ